MEKWSDPPPPLILSKKSITFGHKKSVQKLWIGRDPPPPLRKNSIKKQQPVGYMLPLA